MPSSASKYIPTVIEPVESRTTSTGGVYKLQGKNVESLAMKSSPTLELSIAELKALLGLPG